MTTNYLSGRQNAVTAANSDQLNRRLVAIAEHFGPAWLGQGGDNPLQKLWSRTDVLATNELLNFGDAVLRFSTSNSNWLERQADAIKNGDAGNRSGAIFELLGLNLFQSAGYRVVASKDKNPGYDGVVHLDEHASLWVSIKNHGISSFEQYFRDKAIQLERKFRECLRQRNQTGIELWLFNGAHPQLSDWDALEEDMELVLRVANTPQANEIKRKSDWNIVVKSVPPQYQPLSAHHLSSIFFIAAKIHQNEQAKFIEDVRKGCANLAKHVKNAPEGVCPTLLVRLSATASVSRCAEWAKEYFVTYPDEPIGVIILYQAVVVTDVVKETSPISHYLIPVTSPAFQKWRGGAGGIARRLPNMSVLVGVIGKPTKQVLTDGKTQIEIDDCYAYQKGDIYRFFKKGDKVLNFRVSNPAPGIMIHAEVEIEGQSGVVQMIAPNQHDLLLLP